MENFQSIKEKKFSNPENNPILRRFAEVVLCRGAEAAVFRPDGSVARTFREIDEAAWRWADIFRGVGKKNHAPTNETTDLVAIQVGNVPEWPEVLLGAWRAGWCAVPMDADMTGPRRDRVEETCGISQRVVWRDGEAVMEQGRGRIKRVGADLLKLTSGTTGEPRAIRFTAGQLLADCDSVCDSMGLKEDDRNFGIISFAHSYGFSNLVTPLLCRGIPLVATADALPRAIVEGLAATGATVLPAVPAHFRALAGLPWGGGRLRLCISAGAPLTVEIARSFSAGWGCKIHSFYGASECGGICFDAGGEPDRPSGFVGRPMERVVLESSDAGTASSRRMWVRSPAVGSGYFPGEDADLRAGLFQPADLLEWQGEGYVITGRVSDVINVAGRKVNPAEIETVLRSCPGVTDVVVLGLPAGFRGEDVAACIVGDVGAEALRVFCAARLAGWQIPRQWIHLLEIPLNARGKVSRSDLRRQIAGRS